MVDGGAGPGCDVCQNTLAQGILEFLRKPARLMLQCDSEKIYDFIKVTS